MKYFSESKNKNMEISDMHLLHIENVLVRDKESMAKGTGSILGLIQYDAMVHEYIVKSKADRAEKVRLLKNSVGMNKMLSDLIALPKEIPTQAFGPQGLTPTQLANARLEAKGFERVPVHHMVDLRFARNVAIRYIQNTGRISADVLRYILQDEGGLINGQVLTHVFRDKRFKQIGYQRSEWAGAKGRFINVWTVT